MFFGVVCGEAEKPGNGAGCQLVDWCNCNPAGLRPGGEPGPLSPHKITTNELKEDYERRDDDAASGEGFAVGDDGNCSAQRRQPACRTSGWPLNALDRSGRCNGRPSALSKSCGDGLSGSH